MAERYRNVSAAAEELKAQYAREQEENKRMKEVILQIEAQGRPSVSDPELQQKPKKQNKMRK